MSGPYGPLGPPAAPHAVVVACSETDIIPVRESHRNKVFAVIPIPEVTGSGPSGLSALEAATAATDTALDRTRVVVRMKFKIKSADPKEQLRLGLNGPLALRAMISMRLQFSRPRLGLTLVRILLNNEKKPAWHPAVPIGPPGARGPLALHLAERESQHEIEFALARPSSVLNSNSRVIIFSRDRVRAVPGGSTIHPGLPAPFPAEPVK